MSARVAVRRVLAVGCCVVLTATGCAFHGLNSLPLPGTVGRGAGAAVYHVEVANVGTLESNSPVMIDDVVVGSVGDMTVRGWHADLEVSVQPGVVIPANAVATVG
ncbi:MAG: MlaD family protein, partial [Mycobacterium sp.]